MLSSLEIKNFRTFSHLFIERLGRVNLVVGKNNVGKTTLLEALRLYASIWPSSTVMSILHERNEVAPSTGTGGGASVLLLHSLFHGREVHEGDEITIRQHAGSEAAGGFHATASFKIIEGSAIGTTEHMFPAPAVPFLHVKSPGPGFTLSPDGLAAHPFRSTSPKLPDFLPDPPCLLGVGAQHGMEDTIADWWDAFSLTDAEQRVLDALQLVAPIRGMRFVGDPREGAGRMAKARVNGIDEPVALATQGDGVVRMFRLAVALQSAALYGTQSAGVEHKLENVLPLALIDEVEVGIHHSLHAGLWRFILHAARLLDVQVVATTHSHDCLMGFAQALADDEQADGQVVRLERSEGEEATRAVVISREKLPIVARDDIEVR
ncbi:MAG: AAA family ATPase [Planctomycetota bacterium]